MTKACTKCGHEEYDPMNYPQYTVEGQDIIQYEYKPGKWKDEKKLRQLCITRKVNHRMKDTFLPGRGTYQKCEVCGYFTCTHGGSYY